ncbi:hypothetical protein [Actinopolymorpha pittospori]|uniref:Uncharacterized protein n=1 Tax=Actinopolymorpha pittospori TaxID=648752 RepID=A0A927RBA0_9ACTN|nr:hypothetical protein [Actinopolymorpha pittospori]MBE1609917.1 hypothetical protein [Actinopolymorpha pittospori]
MSNASHRGNGLANSPGEEMLLIHIALAALGVLVGSAGVLWLKGTTWLVEHGVLAPASAPPLLEIPGADGAGLDRPRIAIATAALLAVVAVAVSWARRVSVHRRENLA